MRDLRMTISAAAAVIGLTPLFLPVALAQQPAQPPQAEQQQQTPQVSEEEIDTFATIYVELQETAAKFEEEMAGVASEQEAQEVQSRMQKETIDKLERHGWTTDRFNYVAQAINRDPKLVERALQLIDEKS